MALKGALCSFLLLGTLCRFSSASDLGVLLGVPVRNFDDVFENAAYSYNEAMYGDGYCNEDDEQYGELCRDLQARLSQNVAQRRAVYEEDRKLLEKYLKGKLGEQMAEHRQEIEEQEEIQELQSDNDSSPSAQCVRDRMVVAVAKEKPTLYEWAFAYENADAKDTFPSIGTLLGRPYELGSYDLCNRIKATNLDILKFNDTYPNGTSVGQHDFDAHYCHTRWYSPTDAIGNGEGWCVPSSCDRHDVKMLMSDNPSKPLKYTFCGTKPPLNTNTGAIIALCVIGFFGLLVVAATGVDLVKWLIVDLRKHNNNGDDDEEDKTPTERPGKLKRALLSFSLLRNIPTLLAAGGSRSTYGCMNGLKVIAMTWIVLGHTFQLETHVFTDPRNIFIENYFSQFDHSSTLIHQLINNMNNAVEIFFFLGAALVTLSFMKTIKRLENSDAMTRIGEMFLYVFHRYWRLTPLLAAVILIYGNLWQYMSFGPQWPEYAASADSCRTHWWVNLLYIQNLYMGSGQCMGWTWYLANDFQFFLVVPIFTVVYYIKPFFGPVLLFLAWLGTTIARAVLVSKGAGYFDLYVKPWARFGPYAQGIAMGFILYNIRGKKIKLNKFLMLFGWMVAFLVGLLVIFGTYQRGTCEGCIPWSKPEETGYNVLRRDAFTLCIGWIVFACVNGYGGIINSFLAWELWTPISKLTYCGYLIHPMIHFITLAAREKAIYVDRLSMVYWYLGNITFTLIVSFGLSLVFEVPFLELEKIILPDKKKPQPKKSMVDAAPADITTDAEIAIALKSIDAAIADADAEAEALPEKLPPPIEEPTQNVYLALQNPKMPYTMSPQDSFKVPPPPLEVVLALGTNGPQQSLRMADYPPPPLVGDNAVPVVPAVEASAAELEAAEVAIASHAVLAAGDAALARRATTKMAAELVANVAKEDAQVPAQVSLENSPPYDYVLAETRM